MKCSVRQNFHSLPYPFANLFKLDTFDTSFRLYFQWFSLGMEEEGVRWLEWKGYFLQPNNSRKDFVNKSAKAKNNLIGDYSVQSTLMTQSFLPSDSGPLPPQYPYPYFFNSSPKKCLSYFFFLGRPFTRYNIKWAKGVLLQPK